MEYDLEKLSEKIQKKKRIKRFLNIFLMILLIILLLFNAIIVDNEGTENVNNDLGLHAFCIVSKSMLPTFKVYDIIIIKKYDFKDLKEGDIITFKQDGKIITHRISEIEKGGLIHTKGDNNNKADNFSIEYSDIYGRFIFKIPKVGKIVQILHKKNVLISVIIVIFVLFLLINFKQEKKLKRKKIRKKYDVNENSNKERKLWRNQKNRFSL